LEGIPEVSDRRDTLVDAFKAGNFLETVHACLQADRGEGDRLSLELAALHNEGLIDVVAGFENLKNQSSGPNFFLTRRIFEKALPHLNASVLAVMRCVLRLYRDAGQDMAAGTIIEGFVGFSTKVASRPRDALKEIEADPDSFADLLTPAIAAGSRIDNPQYLAEAIRLSEDKNIELRRHAVYSIGRLNWPEGASIPDLPFATLERSTNAETDDRILAGVVKSAFALWQRDRASEDRSVTLIASALIKGSEQALHAASEVFGFHTSELPTSLVNSLLPHLMRVKPGNKGTLHNIDFGIARLLKKSDPEQAIRFLEDLLLAHSDKLTLEAFGSVVAEIHSNKTLLNKVLTRWFLRGDPVLCEGIHSIVAAHHGGNPQLEIDSDELKPADLLHAVFVARKAIGYLFFQPVSAASVLISLMRHASNEEILKELSQLLFNPLLLNFTGSVRKYVASQAALESGQLKEWIGKSLKAIDDYLDTLRSVGTLPALHPDEAQREAYYRHFSRIMTESFKAAEARSTFLSIISKSILLYGRKSIDYVYATNGQSRRMETNLASHGTEIEYPRLEQIDPYGLDYTLRVFRMERLRA
jgi:hypothetical protein